MDKVVTECDSLQSTVDALRERLLSSESKRHETAKDFETAFRVVRQENDTLARQVDELKAERDKLRNYKDAIISRKAFVKCSHPDELVIGSENGYICVECWAIEATAERDDALQEVERLKIRNVSNGLAYGQMEEEVERFKTLLKRARLLLVSKSFIAQEIDAALVSTPQAL